MHYSQMDNAMTFGEPDAYSLPAEEPVKCNSFVLVGGYWNPHTEPCSESGVPGTETHSCPTHGLAECAEWRGELVAEGGSVGEWAALALNERLYREAAAR